MRHFILAGLSIILGINFSFSQTESHSLLNNNTVHFTENKGQVSDQNYQPRPDVLFSGEVNGLVYHLTKSGVSYQLSKVDSWKKEEFSRGLDTNEIPDQISLYRTDIKWVGSNPNPVIIKERKTAFYNNYYLPTCQEGALKVKSYQQVTYKNLYPGIDLKWYGKDGQLEYDFEISPGADYKNIAWEVYGAQELRINKNGELIISTPLGEIIEQAPIAYQGNKIVKAHWKLRDNKVSFKLGNYDKSLPLIIDPIVAAVQWATYFGGSGYDISKIVLVDAKSSYYLGESTTSTSNIATSGAFQTTINAPADFALAKFNKKGKRQWATYYGGNGSEGLENGCIDGSANIYLVGWGSSTSGFSTGGVQQSNYGGGLFDGMMVKFDSTGNRIWATYVGGEDHDRIFGADIAGSVIYITGLTGSDTNMTTAGSHQSTRNTGASTAFLMKFNTNGSRLWGTYYGANGYAQPRACAVDLNGDVYMSGHTASIAGIATPGSYQSSFIGSPSSTILNAFLAKFDASGTRLWGTYYGSPTTFGWNCTTDKLNNVYLLGYTSATTGIATPNSHQSSYVGGGTDLFIVKFSANGSRKWASYYGGVGNEIPFTAITDDSLNIYFAGETSSPAYIATPGSHQTAYGGGLSDAFMVKMDSTGKRKWSTYYGGSGDDTPYSLKMDTKDSSILLNGTTTSSQKIATPGSYQTSHAGGNDAFLAKFGECLIDSISIDTTVCSQLISPSGNFTWTTSGIYEDVLTNNRNCDSVLTINLTVNNTTDTIIDTSCTAYTSPSGKFNFNESGVYLDTIPNMAGCDSLLTIQLNVDTIDTEIRRYTNLIASQDNTANYQWIDCSDNSIIPGATTQIFTATSNGSYAVILSKHGCSDTSACLNMTKIGIEELISENISLHPNPTNGKVKLKLPGSYDNIDLRLLNIQGQTMKSWTFPKLHSTTLQLDVTPGLYLLEIKDVEQSSVIKLVVE